MPADVKQTVEAAHVELVELSGVHGSVLTVEWGGEDNCSQTFNLVVKVETTMLTNVSEKSAEVGTCVGNSFVDLHIDVCSVGEN